MRRTTLLIILSLVIGHCLPWKGSFVKPAYAQSTLLSSGEVIESDYIRTGDTIQIDGEIKGDAFLIGGVVTVNGKVDGDLFIVAGKANINGEVGNSVRILAGDVTVNSGITRNLLLICGNCVVTKQATIGGSLIAAGGNTEISAGSIGRGFRFLGSRLFLNSAVTNEAFVVADKEFLLGPNASISGNLKYTGNSAAVLELGATVAGNIAYEKQNQDENYPRFFGAKTVLGSYQKVKPLAQFLMFFVSALVGFVLLGLFPRGFEKVVRGIENRPYASLGWGVIVAVAAPVVGVLFALTIVGIPVAAILFIIYYLLFVISQYLAAFFVGRKVLLAKFGERRGWAIVLGLFLFMILDAIPVVGGLVKVILILFALGAAILAYKQPVIIQQRSFDFAQDARITPRKRGRPAKR